MMAEGEQWDAEKTWDADGASEVLFPAGKN